MAINNRIGKEDEIFTINHKLTPSEFRRLGISQTNARGPSYTTSEVGDLKDRCRFKRIRTCSMKKGVRDVGGYDG